MITVARFGQVYSKTTRDIESAMQVLGLKTMKVFNEYKGKHEEFLADIDILMLLCYFGLQPKNHSVSGR